MTVSLVLLNYNDACQTISSVKRVHDFNEIDQIIVVDNHSMDSSLEDLKKSFSQDFPKVSLIETKKNGGYGYGNNCGVKYAVERLGAELVLIANPDTEFDEALIAKMKEVFETRSNAACAGAIMVSKTHKKCKSISETDFDYSEFKLSGWMYRGLLRAVLHSGPLMKRIFARFLDYPKRYYDEFLDYVPVYAVSGALLMVDGGKFLRVGGYDESMFLYMEEDTLANRFSNSGYETFLLKHGFIHLKSHSIALSGYDFLARQKLRQKSELIYFKKYLHAGKMSLFIVKIFQFLVFLETKLWMILKRPKV